MDRSPSFGAVVDLGNRVSFYIDESLQSVYGQSNDSLALSRGRRRPGPGVLRRQASAEPNRRHSIRVGDASSNRRLRRHVSDAAAMERPPLARHGSVSGGRSGRGRRISRHESDTRRPSRNRSLGGRGSIRGSAYQVSPQAIDIRRQSSQRASLKSRSDSDEVRTVPKGTRKPSDASDPEAAAEEEKAMAKERRHRMAVTIILATFFFLVVSSVLVVVVTLTQTTFHNAPAPSNRTFGQQPQNTQWVRKENEQMMNSLNRASNSIVATEDNIGGTEMNVGVSDSAAAAVVTINSSVMGTEERFGTSPSSSTKGTP